MDILVGKLFTFWKLMRQETRNKRAFPVYLMLALYWLLRLDGGRRDRCGSQELKGQALPWRPLPSLPVATSASTMVASLRTESSERRTQPFLPRRGHPGQRLD